MEAQRSLKQVGDVAAGRYEHIMESATEQRAKLIKIRESIMTAISLFLLVQRINNRFCY